MTQENGEPYTIKSVSVPFALVDLWNPEARDWIKQVIKENMIEEAGAWGWMHDFGEYTPLDSNSACGEDMWLLHNDYPLEWAKVAEIFAWASSALTRFSHSCVRVVFWVALPHRSTRACFGWATSCRPSTGKTA